MILIMCMAGKGQRCKDEGYTLPKPLILVDGKPMFARAMDDLPTIKRSVFVCLKEHDSAQVVRLFYPDATICLVNNVTEGYACSCERAIDDAEIDENEPILISACDSGATYDKQKFMNLVSDTQNDIVVWSFRNSQTSKVNPDMYSWLNVDANDYIKSVSCKKFPGGNPMKMHAIIGTMYFRKAKYLLDGLTENRIHGLDIDGEFQVDDVLNRNIESGLKVKVFEVDHYVSWGTPSHYKTYNYWKEHFNA